MQDLEQSIRERAYHLWTANGRQEGNAEAHWLTAQREILASSLGTVANVSATHGTPGTPRKVAKKTPSKKVRAA
jgi:cysteine synthase